MNARGDATRGVALGRYRAEVLRGAAALIRLGLIPSPLGETEEAINDAIARMADEIDPDKN